MKTTLDYAHEVRFSLDYKRHTALAAYIDRIGAVEIHFRKFMVQIEKGKYYKEKGLIWIKDDYSLAYKELSEDLQATDAEAAAIQAELTAAKSSGQLAWPTSINATPAQVKALRRTGLIEGRLYEFIELDGTDVIMCQERRDFEDGTKAYLPWSMWSDGTWRMMEPERDLPFWKPKKTGPFIMIHEGAKTAAFLTAGLEDGSLRDHPWHDEIKDWSHWGMIGGALAPHRADYNEIRKAKPREVVYVCDNDDEGKSAITTISKIYGDRLDCIQFDHDFPPKWDLADPMPEKCFGPLPEKRWLGPSLDSLTIGATWATDVVPGKTRSVTKIRRVFAKQWFHSVRPEVFIHEKRTGKLWVEKEFNNLVHPFSDIHQTSNLLTKDIASKSVTVEYNPSKPPGLFTLDGERFINTHMPTLIRPVAGSAGPFEDFMAHFIPEPRERMFLKKWLATLVARPDIRMAFAVLLVSETQGTGKTTLCDIAANTVGLANTSWPSEAEIVESNYTYYCARKRLACVSEIYQGHSHKAYNKLKDKITDAYITVSEKYIANYTISNWLHIIACSNDKRALKLDAQDRRWFIPTVVEETLDRTYWDNFYHWLRRCGGYGIIMAELLRFAAEDGTIGRSERAPATEAKDEMIEEGYSDGQKFILDLLRILEGEANGKALVLWDEDLRELLKTVIHQGRTDRLEKCQTIRKVAKRAGWHVGDARVMISQIGMGQKQARLISNRRGPAQMKAAEFEIWRDEVVSLAGVDLMARAQNMGLM
jgi:hypothetical protein